MKKQLPAIILGILCAGLTAAYINANRTINRLRGEITQLKEQPELNLPDACYTLQVGRKSFNHRRMIVCQNHFDAVSTLESADSTSMFTVNQERRNPPVAFMFSGQGAQYINMALELYKTEPLFQEQMDTCADILKPHLSLDLRELLYPDDNKKHKSAANNLKKAN